jgi:HlyD family secretion protein
MYQKIKQIFRLLNKKQKREFLLLQTLVVLTAFLELVGVASIMPFMAVVASPQMIETNSLLNGVYNFTQAQNTTEFTIYLGVTVLVALTLSASVSVITTWWSSMFASKIGAEIGQTLYDYYLHQNWIFHATRSSAQLTKQIAAETSRLTGGVLVPLMALNARFVLALMLSVAIVMLNPVVALIGISIFMIAYLVIYKLVKARLEANGNKISKTSEERYRLMNEGFGGVKDVILLGRQADFKQRFGNTSQTLAISQGQNIALSQVPRYFLEVLAFGALIALIISLLIQSQGDLAHVLPLLSVYALAGFKLLPAFQQIYSNLTAIKGNISAFDSIKEDLSTARTKTEPKKNNMPDTEVENDELAFKSKIELKNITFTYPGKSKPALDNLNIAIKKNQIIGFVGASGSGKSTAVDMLMGLLKPQQGRLLIDGVEINQNNQRAWQNKIGYVAQSIFLSEGTIAENVAFGISQEQININKVNKALSLAHLDELIQTLEKGIHTKVGERGVQLSGGQRQRIGIARALYHDAEVLVFDEATSALDGITEKMIMEAIHDFSGSKTIIMIAHRLKTVQNCDQIFLLDKGKLIDAGTYQKMLESNQSFKKMAIYS